MGAGFQCQPGKEILYTVATVILGGLISSTLLDMIATPVVFKQFGKKVLDKYIEEQNKDPFKESGGNAAGKY